MGEYGLRLQPEDHHHAFPPGWRDRTQLAFRSTYSSIGRRRLPLARMARVPYNPAFRMAIPPGTRLGPFEVAAQIGAGGMGAVYRAYDPRLQRTVAIKLLGPAVPDSDARARLLREARSASALNHPHICTIYDVGEHSGGGFIAMEYVDGQPLSALIAGRGLPTADVLRYGLQIADAISHAHERGVLHRDLKSANVIIASTGTAKVVDFGLAKRVADAASAPASQYLETQPGTVAGTIYAMAPEQLHGEPADPRTDVWALGVLLYEMAAGSPPFGGRTAFELTSAILRDAPAPLPPHVPVGLRRIVERCLAKDTAERYQRASDVRAALEAVAEGRTSPVGRDAGDTVVTGTLMLEPDSSSGAITAASQHPTTPIALPPLIAATSAHEPAVVGREQQLGEMDRLWERVRSGRRHVVMLAGEPGIGKTRLAFEFCRQRHAEGATVLFGRCDEEALLPYQPFVEALDYYVTSCPEAEFRRDVAESGIGSELARVVPTLPRRAPDLPPISAADPEGQRYRLFEAVAALLGVMSQRRPVLLLLDDLHWADKPTLLLLRHLARAQHDGAICIVGTYRDTELGRTHPLAELLADLRRERTVLRLPLSGLPPAGVRELIRAWSAPAAAREFAKLLADQTGGNPFSSARFSITWTKRERSPGSTAGGGRIARSSFAYPRA